MAGKIVDFKAISRCFHSTSYNFSNIHKTFRKVLSSHSSKKRKLNFENFPMASPINFKQGEEKNKLKPVFRRVTVLNKMFMGHITDLIVNGELWEQYNNLGIEITKVEISQDYKKLNIFWINKKTENKTDIINFLAENTYTLRHELSQLKVVGMVPPISFVEDKTLTRLMELDRRMSEADYGDDYEPLSVSRLKHQLELYCPLQEDIKSQLEKLEVGNEERALDVDLPEMPQNVLGLDHADIMKRLLNPKKTPITNISGYGNPSRTTNEDLEEISSRDAFKAFLHKRQLINQKMKKEDKNYSADMDYLKEEMSRSFEEHYDNIEGNMDTFEDFIEDENEEK